MTATCSTSVQTAPAALPEQLEPVQEQESPLAQGPELELVQELQLVPVQELQLEPVQVLELVQEAHQPHQRLQ